MKTTKATKEIQKTELEKAQEVLQKAHQKKIDDFMKDYKEICVKHGMELTANPKIEWNITPIQK